MTSGLSTGLGVGAWVLTGKGGFAIAVASRAIRASNRLIGFRKSNRINRFEDGTVYVGIQVGIRLPRCMDRQRIRTDPPPQVRIQKPLPEVLQPDLDILLFAGETRNWRNINLRSDVSCCSFRAFTRSHPTRDPASVVDSPDACFSKTPCPARDVGPIAAAATGCARGRRRARPRDQARASGRRSTSSSRGPQCTATSSREPSC
jgi:hypothetical protein